MKGTRRFGLIYFFLLLWAAILVHDLFVFKQNIESIPYSQFLVYVSEGKVSDVAIGGERIDGTLKEAPQGHPKQFVTLKVEDPQLVSRLTKADVKFSGVEQTTFWRDMLSWIVPAAVLVGLWTVVMRRMGQVSRGGGMLSIGKSKAKIYAEKGLGTRFSDVAGVDEAKVELREVVDFLRNPAHYSRLGGRMPKGVLLVGAPGTGKTLLARAVAGEANVTFFSINGSEFVELFVGLGAARVRDLFEQARGEAPCIIFIDELDALGKARGLTAITGSSNDEKEQTLNQLLAEMDGFDTSKGIIVLAATNRPEVLDPALLRAGRFDRQIAVDKPDRQGRVQILKIHLGKIKLGADVSEDTLASMTAGFSGADLANLVNEAALMATRRGAEFVELRDCTAAIERIVAGLERKNRLLSPPEKRRVAFHEMGHATVALALGEGEVIHKVSIIPRGIAALGYTLRRPIEDRYLMGLHELKAKMAIALGGRAAEQRFFDEISTGAADDLDKATEIARAMITRYGMSSGLGLAILERDSAPILGGASPVRSYDYSEKTAQQIDDEIRRLLNEALASANRVVDRFREFLTEGAEILLSRETIDEQELKALWGKHHGGAVRLAG